MITTECGGGGGGGGGGPPHPHKGVLGRKERYD